MSARTREMLGEFCREFAVLIFVFVPLDALGIGALTLKTVAVTVVVSGGMLACGIFLDPGRTSSGPS